MASSRATNAFAPSAWWVWLLIGFVGLLCTIIAGTLFGIAPIDVLLGREGAVVLFIAFDYTFLGLGIWLGVNRLRSKWNERNEFHE